MPHCYNPNSITFGFIEKSIWRNNYLSIGKVREFRDDSTGFREFFEPAKDFFSPIPEIDCSRRLILPNV
jgi:hypothetical protein